MSVFILLAIGLINFSSANLGTFQQNECMDIKVLANCSSIDLIEVGDGNQTFNISSTMTHISGQTWIYEFCNTSKIGTYSYSWNNPCVDCSSNDCGNSFEITYTGTSFDIQDSYIYIIALVSLILGAIGLWFIYGHINSQHSTDGNGNLLFINYKGLLKPVILSGIWIIILVCLFIISNMGLAFLPNPMIGNLFLTIYKVLFWVTIIILPLLGIAILAEAVALFKLEKIVSRGGRVEDSSKF